MMLGKKGRKNTRKGVEKEEFTPSMVSETRPSFSTAASGYLQKKASHAPYRWQKRFFVATGKYVRYYQNEECTALLAAIELWGTTIEGEGERNLVLTTNSGNRVLLRANDEETRDEWLAGLTILRRGLGGRDMEPDETKDEAKRGVASPGDPDQVSTVAELDPKVATRRQNVTKLKNRHLSDEAVRESMVRTPRNSFPAAAAGFLQKKATSHKLAGWQTRFFVACGHYLRYYASDAAGADLLGAIDLDGVSIEGIGVDDPTDDGIEREFSLKMADADVRLRAATPLERAQWVSSLLEMKHQLSVQRAQQRQVSLETTPAKGSGGGGGRGEVKLDIRRIVFASPKGSPAPRQPKVARPEATTTTTTTTQAPRPPSTRPPVELSDVANTPKKRGCCGVLVF
ncbi:hypothetical protein CTAYLR_006058 [Chrysophaeum taylorii]|uniref:PH domain-containing protein n=1 Tax=Chrysophaeum taylorii TaxID=2483200 RepID=A0AAD7ULA8_9STRA|nr:hypothetical protein CTAYLR_006058 [Chrysophaeum taylorii]